MVSIRLNGTSTQKCYLVPRNVWQWHYFVIFIDTVLYIILFDSFKLFILFEIKFLWNLYNNWLRKLDTHIYFSLCLISFSHSLFHIFILFISIHLFYISIISSVVGDNKINSNMTHCAEMFCLYIYLMPSKDGSLILIKTH